MVPDEPFRAKQSAKASGASWDATARPSVPALIGVGADGVVAPLVTCLAGPVGAVGQVMNHSRRPHRCAGGSDRLPVGA